MENMLEPSGKIIIKLVSEVEITYIRFTITADHDTAGKGEAQDKGYKLGDLISQTKA